MSEKKKRKKCATPDSSSEPSVSSQKSVSQPESPRCESLKSDNSMFHPLNFKSQRLQLRGSEPGASTTESVMRDSSEHESVNLDDENTQSQPTSCSVYKEGSSDPVQLICEHWICKQCVESDWYQSHPSPGFSCPECGKKSKMKSGRTFLGRPNKMYFGSTARPEHTEHTGLLNATSQDPIVAATTSMPSSPSSSGRYQGLGHTPAPHSISAPAGFTSSSWEDDSDGSPPRPGEGNH